MLDVRFQPRNLLGLLAGMVIASAGIAMVTIAGLGTTPISTVPLVWSKITGLTFGTMTFLLNIVFVLIQKAIFKDRFASMNWFQIPITLVFGICIDLWMMAVAPLANLPYVAQWAVSLTGNLVLALGITLQIAAKCLMLPGDGVVIALAYVFKRTFEKMKVTNDVCLVHIAIFSGLIFLGQIEGIREGTFVSALTVGVFIKLWRRVLKIR